MDCLPWCVVSFLGGLFFGGIMSLISVYAGIKAYEESMREKDVS